MKNLLMNYGFTLFTIGFFTMITLAMYDVIHIVALLPYLFICLAFAIEFNKKNGVNLFDNKNEL